MPAVTGPMMRHARTIASVGRRMGMDRRDIVIALMAALTESGLRNVHYGDRDSLGLFQQRPSQGWGTRGQVLNPEYAARRFFIALRQLGPRRHRMGLGPAAQAVQRSAHPGRYAQNLDTAHYIMRRLGRFADNAGGGGRSGRGGRGKGAANTFFGGLGPGGFSNSGPVQIIGPVGQMPLSEPLEDGSDENQAQKPFNVNPRLGAARFMELGPRGFAPELGPRTGVAGLPAFAPQPLPLGKDDFANLFGVTGMMDNLGSGGPIGWGGLGGGGRGGGRGGRGGGGGGRGGGGGSIGTAWRRQVVRAARTALGTPYDWGGNSLARGVDCSGLVQQAYRRAGISMPRVSADQARVGRRVGIKDLKPGDLVAWNNSSRNRGADHIAIYIGGGRIIEAARPGTRVHIRRLGRNEGAWGVRAHR